MNSENIILRETDNAPLTNKGDFITGAEIDSNFIAVYNDFVALAVTLGVTAYDSGTTYDDTDKAYVTYNSKLWQWVNVSSGMGITPGSNDNYWVEVFPTILAHEKNKDTYLDKGGSNETTAQEIRDFIDAGLTSTTNLGITAHGDSQLTLTSSTGDNVDLVDATQTQAGLLSAEDKIKLVNTSGQNTGDQTLDELGGESTANKVDDFTTIDAEKFPTTNATEVRINEKIDDHESSLANHDDVDLLSPSPVSGNVLSYNGSVWVPMDIPTNTGKIGVSDSNGEYTFYDTIALANAGATSGDVVEFFADVEETGATEWILKDGVNYNLNGHTYTLNNAGTSDAVTDNAVAVNCTIFNGTIKRTGGTANDSNSIGLHIDSTTSDVTLKGVVIKNDFGVASRTDGILRGGSHYGETKGIIAPLNSSNIYDLYCYGETSYGVFSYGSIYNCVCESNTSYGGYLITSVEAHNSSFYSAGSQGANIRGAKLFSCSFRSDGSYGAYFQTATNYAENCSFYSTSSYALHTIATTRCFNCSAVSTASYAVWTSVELYGVNAYSTANSAFYCQDNTVKLYNCTGESNSASCVTSRGYHYNCSFICTWNDANGHAITDINTASQYNDVFNCYLEVANASAYCLGSATTAKTVFFGQNTFKGATTGVNTTYITQGQTNAPDTYNNILIG